MDAPDTTPEQFPAVAPAGLFVPLTSLSLDVFADVAGAVLELPDDATASPSLGPPPRRSADLAELYAAAQGVDMDGFRNDPRWVPVDPPTDASTPRSISHVLRNQPRPGPCGRRR